MLDRTENGGTERLSPKWDRAARYLRIATILHGHPQGLRATDLAERVGVSRRTVYRDLNAMSDEAGIPLWQEGGRWGLGEGLFLPPLNLTLHEAMALFLAARVLLKASDERDSELIGSLAKLARILPPILGEHVQRAVDVYARMPVDDRFTRVFRTLTQAWAERRIVVIDYDVSVYEPSRDVRRARVHPYLIEPSALTHALYLIGYDEERAARRTFKVERILEAALTPDRFEPVDDYAQSGELDRAWDVISDQPVESIVVRFSAAVAKRVAETRWHPSQELEPQPDGALIWRARVAGTLEVKIWILGWGAEAEVLEPAGLRREVAADVRQAAERYRP
ncbi:MAG TPA: WYL domain-containing transcriptional regulator [Candidatus Limnocylindrales bacterium]|jgi:proteasome accessory factor B|nr:WYL domain-containing transcriptional regulator [Candidatus Limnocylindrales bacterium]